MTKEELMALFKTVYEPLQGEIAELKAKLQKDNSAELTTQLKAAEDKAAEFEVKLGKLETRIFDASQKPADVIASVKAAFVQELLKTNSTNIGTFVERVKSATANFALADGQNITDSVDGGYLVPKEMAEQILNATVNEIAPLLGLTRRFPMGQNLTINVRVDVPTVNRQGEGETATKSKSQYAPVSLNAKRASVTVPATFEYLNFTQGDAVNRITSDVAEAYAAKFLWELLNGNGTTQMEGILTHSKIEKIETAAVGAISYDDLVDLESAVQTNNTANLRYVMDRRTLGAIRKLQDGAGNYIYQPGTASKPATINGIPVTETGVVKVNDGATIGNKQIIPLIDAGTTPILLGDFTGYAFGDAKGLVLMFDDKTGASEAIFNWNFHAWNDGKVALPEKFKLLKIKS